MQRIAITGSSGYYGTRLIEHIRQQTPQVQILGCDVAAPRTVRPDVFHQMDVRDRRLVRALEEFRPDTVVHLAFIVNPIHNERRMTAINVAGSENVFDAVTRLRPQRFLAASSATAYGPFPDNPLPLDESGQIRARPDFRYALDKTELEARLVRLAEQLADTAVSWTRPAIIYGPGVSNYLSQFLLRLPIVVLMDGADSPLQFVHEDDVAAATYRILRANGRGPFNIGPPDWVRLSEIAADSGRPIIKLPFWMIRIVTTCWWTLRLPAFPFPPGLLYYLRHPWVVAPHRLEREIGYRFRYSSRDTLREMLRIQGNLARHLRDAQPQQMPLEKAG